MRSDQTAHDGDFEPLVVPTGNVIDLVKSQGGISRIAKAAGRKVAASKDVRKVRRLADGLQDLTAFVGKVTRSRDDINQIAAPMLEAVVKAGRLLLAMAAEGEPKTRGGDQKSNSRGDSSIPTLKDLGFSHARAARWQLAAQLPDAEREKYKAGVLAADDGILTIAGLVKAAEAWLLTHRLDKDGPSTWRKKLLQGGEVVSKQVVTVDKLKRAYRLMAREPAETKLQLMLALAADLKDTKPAYTNPNLTFRENWQVLQEGEDGYLIERSYWTLILALMKGENAVDRILNHLLAVPFNKQRSFLENLMTGKSLATEDLVAVPSVTKTGRKKRIRD